MIFLMCAPVFTHGQSDNKTDLKIDAAVSNTDIAAKSFNQAKELIAANRWAEAAEKLNFIITKHPNSKYYEPSFYWLAYVRKRQEKYREALLLLNEFINKFPESAWRDDAKTLRAELAAQVGDTKIIEEELQNATNDEVKLAALSSLLRLDPDKGLRRAAEILASKTADAAGKNLREGTINLIAKYGGREAADILLNVARNETDKQVRTAAVFGLKQNARDENVLIELVKLVADCDDAVVAEAGLFVISQQENPRAKILLAQIAKTAQAEQTRRNAVDFLGKVKGGAAVGELIELYDTVGEDIRVKREILYILSKTGDASAQTKVFEISRLTDNIGLREEGILSLGRYGNAQIIDRMIRLYDAETRADVKALILSALSKSGQKSALEKLKNAAQNEESPELRKKAAQLLKQRAANSENKKDN